MTRQGGGGATPPRLWAFDVANLIIPFKMETETNVKKQRGGARPGAGRPKREGEVVSLNLRVSPLAKARLAAYAKARGLTVPQAATRLLEALEP